MTAGEITPGYAALRERAAWIDLSARGKIRVTGEDRARLLHAMTTNHIERLKPGEGCYAFFLNAQGRILGDVNVLCFPDRFLLDTEPETRVKLFEHLDRYIIADDVALEDETDRLATIAVEGPESGAILKKMGGPAPEPDHAHEAWDGITVARISSTGAVGFFLFVPMDRKGRLIENLQSAGAIAASPDDARIVRIEHGRPRYGEEMSERFLVQETGQLQGVNFNKGCYLGQEIVERVHSRAQIHRVLRRLEIETRNPPPAGTKTDQVEIASAVFSPASGKTAALAYVRMQFAAPGTELRIGESKAIVADDANAPG